jgi:hypothetical protein
MSIGFVLSTNIHNELRHAVKQTRLIVTNNEDYNN